MARKNSSQQSTEKILLFVLIVSLMSVVGVLGLPEMGLKEFVSTMLFLVLLAVIGRTIWK